MEKFSASISSVSVPFPALGWNSRDNVSEMGAEYAIAMENIFPDGNAGRIRRGYREHADGMGTSPIETLLDYAEMDGTRHLIAGTNGNLYDATTFNASASSLGSGFTEDQWQHTTYLNTLILVNGTDQPQQYDGTTLSNATYTGTGLTDNDLIDVTVYKERLYFVEKNTTSFWYGATGTITGALTEFDVGDFLRLGGKIEWIASVTQGTGSGAADNIADVFVIMSDKGEMLLYEGDDPGTNFALVGRYYMPEPLSIRSKMNFGADLIILHERGPSSLVQILQQGERAGSFTTFTDAIEPSFRDAVRSFGDTFGFELVNYPNGSQAIINVPQGNTTDFQQYVMNTKTGAWCKYVGIPAACWAIHNQKAYFGGSDGKVYEFDKNQNDDGAAISWYVQWPFTYFNDAAREKLFQQAKLYVTASGQIEFAMDINTDFVVRPLNSTVTVTNNAGSPWGSAWGSPWGSGDSVEAEWEALTGLGKSGSLQVRGDYKNTELEIAGAQISFERGGLW